MRRIREPPDIELSLRQPYDAGLLEDMVMDSHRHMGHRLSSQERSALLFDVMLLDSPIVGASRGFEAHTGKPACSVLGRSWRVLLEGSHSWKTSGSTCQDVDSFLRMARMESLNSIADCVIEFSCCHVEGREFQSRARFRMVKAYDWPSALKCQGSKTSEYVFVLSIQTEIDTDNNEDVEAEECDTLDKLTEMLRADVAEIWPSPNLFPAPLSSKCMLLNCVSTAMRREPHVVPRGCVSMSNTPCLVRSNGCVFKIRVEKTLDVWTSRLPFLGFTCTPPKEVESNRYFFGLVPHAFCLPESVMIGGTGEALMWRKDAVLVPKTGKQLEQCGMQRKHLTPQLPEHKRASPLDLRAGDVLECHYTWPGLEDAEYDTAESTSKISLYVNGSLLFAMELEGHLPTDKPLFAVVDVCYCVYQATYLAH
eukprot:TRINITY_DN9733_c0_g1_i1.p1 TRINITY_DN9733_c0_g1~~TRINITY_DN9733_c0_g1_i1.p1  ORF type:complete len:475 (-),score=99.69 TRINITY_DN9733_c0_g1_i1:75-1343(-)